MSSHTLSLNCSSSKRYYVEITSVIASYFLSVTPPPFRPPLLSGLFVSLPGVPVSLFFFLFSFFFFLFLLFLFVVIPLCSLFVLLFNSNPFVIYFSIFQFAILSKNRNTGSPVSITVRVCILIFFVLDIIKMFFTSWKHQNIWWAHNSELL